MENEVSQGSKGKRVGDGAGAGGGPGASQPNWSSTPISAPFSCESAKAGTGSARYTSAMPSVPTLVAALARASDGSSRACRFQQCPGGITAGVAAAGQCDRITDAAISDR